MEIQFLKHTSHFLEISFNKSNFTSPKMDKKLKGTLINFSSVASSVCSYDINNHKEFLSFTQSRDVLFFAKGPSWSLPMNLP